VRLRRPWAAWAGPSAVHTWMTYGAVQSAAEAVVRASQTRTESGSVHNLETARDIGTSRCVPTIAVSDRTRTTLQYSAAPSQSQRRSNDHGQRTPSVDAQVKKGTLATTVRGQATPLAPVGDEPWTRSGSRLNRGQGADSRRPRSQSVSGYPKPCDLGNLWACRFTASRACALVQSEQAWAVGERTRPVDGWARPSLVAPVGQWFEQRGLRIL
jgi:hypothetical protein